jgi:FSR family fosmidomycin resistance protein-like MFS transporter
MNPRPALLLPLIFAAATHFLVDAVAGTLNPLWPRLDTHYHLAGWQNAGLFFLWQMTTSVSQLFFGIYGDRFNSRWLIWVGPLAAIVCLGSIGLTHSPVILSYLLVISGLGIAAYHPEAAALAGSCAPEQRSRAMSIFTLGGFLGQAVGPIYSGSVVDRAGLGGLAWGIAVGLAAIVLLLPMARQVAKQHKHRAVAAKSVAPRVGGRFRTMLLVLVISSLRIIAASGVPVLVAFLLNARHADATETGLVQSAFMLGIGLGGLGCAVLLRSHHERVVLWVCPLVAAPVLVAIPWATGMLLTGLVGLCGILLGASLPVLISYGQQLMPESQRIASSITMGVSWGAGGGAVSIVLVACKYANHFEVAFVVFAIATTISSALCAWLPIIHAAAEEVMVAEAETVLA